MVDGIEECSDVSFCGIGTLGLPENMMDSGDGVGGISHRTKPVTMVEELCFKNGLYHHFHDFLDNSIYNGWNTQGSFFPLSRFIDPYPAYGCRMVVQQGLLDFVNNLFIVLFQDISYPLSFTSRSVSPSIGFESVDGC